jgi:4-alpha-glucanotransferase
MAKIYLSLALHNHQPVGNFGWVIDEAYEKSYLPMVECLERHPKIRLALHYTGPLRDWLVENKPEFFPRLRKLVERGQIEILSGAYYEPVLASLPHVDKIGQVQKQTQSIRDDFGYEATGMWLAERIWEPHLPKPLYEAGVKYTIVDDTHFKNVGYGDEDLFGYYVTEEQGMPLKVFATSMPLRYSLPWSPVENVISWLREQAEDPGPYGLYQGKSKVAVMGDDGEKFGLWPRTYQHVWVEGWMDRFFSALEDNSDWVETIPPGDFAKEHPSLGRVYLPTASYDEMGEWALPPESAWLLPHLKHVLKDEAREDILRFMRGGMWRNFMVKYPEVNQLHKKALWVSNKVHAMPEGRDKQKALDHLWAGQCNCGYWHGVFGGIYLFHIRTADYEHLLHAENLADGVNGKPFIKAHIVDFDLDAVDDVVIASDQQILIFDTNHGGALVEWDYRPATYNILNVLTRRREGYHKDLIDAGAEGKIVTPEMETDTGDLQSIHSTVIKAREADLDKKVMFDWHRRATFLDHFPREDATLDGLYRATYPEQGDFVNQHYQHEIIEESKKRIVLRLWRDGHVWQGSDHIPVRVEKTISVEAGGSAVDVAYTVTNNGTMAMRQRFGVETNWGFAGGSDPHTYLILDDEKCPLADTSEDAEVGAFQITTELWKINVAVALDETATLWRFPLEGISASEAGFERNYQGTMIMPWWHIDLAPGASWSTKLRFELSRVGA